MKIVLFLEEDLDKGGYQDLDRISVAEATPQILKYLNGIDNRVWTLKKIKANTKKLEKEL